MSESARPWWASDGPVDGGIDPDEDPVERMRAARRGAPDDPVADPPPGASDTAPGDEPWLQVVAGALGRLAEAAGAGSAGARTDEHDEGHGIDVCGICPVCVGLRALGESRPELLGHLTEAARHLTLAARSLVERPDGEPDQAPRSGAGERLQQIDLE